MPWSSIEELSRERTWWQHRLWLGRRFFRIKWCRANGGHFEDADAWGYGMKGMVDLFCGRCGVSFKQVPLEDFEQMERVFELINDERLG